MASSADKWGHPFFYATAENAGVSGSGSGFFWQQDSNIFDDSKRGMVRLGKEYDDVDVISESTGEWEFPYASGADYYSFDIGTGHHSGGESHGCEGAHYMVFVTINETPPRFYFAKQMYHGGSKYEKGRMTHPKFTQQIVGNGWFGLCGVRYNKKDGRSSGKDSVIIEIWASPDGSKDKWVKVTSIEDKGGWGSGGNTCGGVSDQVITWSGVQWRFKSGTPEWSLHPIIPEFEDGDNIHCIDEEDMCFSASEKRGYCKNERIPRDTEQKILFKFDSNNGIARLKNASLREIDPSKSFDQTPDQPDTNEQPGETKTIQGKFTLKWDLNSIRTSVCAGAGGVVFYSATPDNDRSVGTLSGGIQRVGQQSVSSTSPINGKKCIQLDVPLYKVGSPGASPVVSAKIWNSTGAVVYTSPTTFDPSTFTGSFVTKTFSFSTNTHVFVTGDIIGIEYTGSSDSNYIVCGYGAPTIGTNYVNYDNGVWVEKEDRDFACDMWQ